jgi:DNA polymerase-3 subunit alpha
MYLVFDTETTGLPRNFNAPITDVENWPRVVQLAWQIHDADGVLVEQKDFLIKPVGFNIPIKAEEIHGISTALADLAGEELSDVLFLFRKAIEKVDFVVGHNVNFDINVMGCEYVRNQEETPFTIPVLDTCTEKTATLCQLPGGRGGKFKLPTLSELYRFLFNESFSEAHNATADVEATTRCFLELVRKNYFSNTELNKDQGYSAQFNTVNPGTIPLIGLQHLNLKAESAKLSAPKEVKVAPPSTIYNLGELTDIPFVHLHNHTQHSILQSTTDVKALISKAVSLGMPAVALTDTGNMMAAFHFEKAANEYNQSVKRERIAAENEGVPFDKKEIIPIIGCEFNICRNHIDKSVQDNGYQVVLLAKNKQGYKNLIKLASIAYTKGMYYVPRIDRELLLANCGDLIALSGNLNGEIPSLILNVGEVQAEEALLWWKATFNDDFYIELGRHNLSAEDLVNNNLLELAKKHQVKIVATNNTYYIEQKDAVAHDVLLCVKANELVVTPKGRGRGFRFGLENNEYYFKSQEEMKSLFLDLPDAISNTMEIVSKCEIYHLAHEVLLPAFDIPSEFIDDGDAASGDKIGENNYLKHLTYEGAKKRYGTLSDALIERIDFELATIKNTGYPGYFLIVQDFCHAARKMGVSVGPGRGSAAGSVVAYCNWITNIDPIKYDLLFERFLNPDRISMPDIDIDFDDEGRSKVIDYVIDKYGANQVAQIITYGTMAAKSAVRDTARVMNLSLPEADRLAKLIPDISLKKLFGLEDMLLSEALKNNQEALSNAKELRRIYRGTDMQAVVLQKAMEIEGSLRNTGIHACGVIITPGDISDFVPVATAKDSDMVCTQYDNSVAEAAGLLKMDFLGLKTLTLIKDAVKIIKENRGIDLDPEEFPIEDLATFELFQRGETVGIFQYESVGMQKNLKELKPTEFADLIAMNALYRPGPIEYIPSFIKRKHGIEPIIYDLDDCAEYLKETYGITVYQEQVMLLSQSLADFTKGEADTLRKAMGKKDAKVLEKMKPTFIERGGLKGHDATKLEKIWKDWEAFASYAFNKSHSTCYAWVAYQTAYLKANYPAEYMASVLSNNMSDIKQVTFFMDECKRMGIPVLGPDVNESKLNFTVNKDGAIRFGMGAIRGLGSVPVEEIIRERQNGPFNSVFEFSKRVNLKLCTKRIFEALVFAGGFDSFSGVHRAQYFVMDTKNRNFLEIAYKYGESFQNNSNSNQEVLFGEGSEFSLPEPMVPMCDPWSSSYALSKEKEMIGIFISGHPLDDYKVEIDSFCFANVGMLQDLEKHKGVDLMMAAIVTQVEHRLTKNGDPFGTLVFEDYTDQYRLNIFQETYLKFKHFLTPGVFITVRGRIEVPRRRTELEFVLNNIELLQDLREKRAKNMQLKISNKELNHLMIDKLNGLFTSNIGDIPVQFIVYDHLDGVEVSLPSKSIRIKPNPILYKELSEMDIEFKLN